VGIIFLGVTLSTDIQPLRGLSSLTPLEV